MKVVKILLCILVLWPIYFAFQITALIFFYYLLTKKLFYDYKCRTYFFVYRCHKPIHSYMMSPAGSLPPLDMKDNMSRLVLSRCENWLFKQFASLCCCCWTRQSRTRPAKRFWVECSVIQFVHLVPAYFHYSIFYLWQFWPMYTQVGEFRVSWIITTVPLTRFLRNTIFSRNRNARKVGNRCTFQS